MKSLPFLFMFLCQHLFAQNPTVTISVDASTTVMPDSRLLFGTSFDARTGMNGNTGYVGYFTPAGSIVPAIETDFKDFPLSTVRYPGQGIMTGFDWKKSVGLPSSSRASQNILGPVGPSQPVEFGFDEFVKWCFSKGISGNDIQIMVPIYDAAQSWTPVQQAQAKSNVAQYCADWVEYANAKNDGSNPRGGTDWAAQRAANGHPQPYGIKIWNMGNEPWSPNEFTSTGASSYLTTIKPIVDSMLAADPSIKISLPAVGSPTSNWNSALLNSQLVSAAKVYGLSPHAFPDEKIQAKRVSAFLTVYPALASAAKAKNLKIFLGDFAHDVPGNASQALQDLAMQWEGVTLAADYLLGASQINNIERVNFWTFGLTVNQYHPIRLLNGTYTMLPVAQFYKQFQPLVLDHSIDINCTSPAGTDGNSYAVNASAFESADDKDLHVMAVNRDLQSSHLTHISGLNGYTLKSSKLYNASGPAAEVYAESAAVPNGNGDITIPASSIILLQYEKTGAGISEFQVEQNVNTQNASLRFPSELKDAMLTIMNSAGQIMRSYGISGDHCELDLSELNHGIYFFNISYNGKSFGGKLLKD